MDYYSKYIKYKKKYLNLQKQQGGGGDILDEDIMYQDKDVRILKPTVKKGIIIWTRYTEPSEMKESICDVGLKTGEQLYKEGIDFKRSIYHPYIFFKAPYYSKPIDRRTFVHEYVSSYGKKEIYGKILIRVDPDNTYVYSSEIRNIFVHTTYYGNVDNVIKNSRKTLTQYLEIIKQNEEIEKKVPIDKTIYYNMFTSKAILFDIKVKPPSPFDMNPINYNSEILVRLPHLQKEYFVYCSKPK